MRDHTVRDAWREMFEDADDANAAEEALVEATQMPLADLLQRAQLGARVLEILGPDSPQSWSEQFLSVKAAARSLGLLGDEAKLPSEEEQRIDQARAEAAREEPNT